MDRQPSKLGVLIGSETALGTKSRAVLYLYNCKIIQVMMQNMYIAYMRGFENKPKYIKGSLVEKSTIKAKKTE
jgi:hypothetical protein